MNLCGLKYDMHPPTHQRKSQEKGCTPAQLALAEVIQQPGITSVIIGPRTVEQLEDSLEALTDEFTDEDKARIDEVSNPGQAIVSYYWNPFWAGWRPNQFRW